MKTLAALLVSAALAPWAHGAGEVRRLPNGNVSIDARGAQLGLMLRQFHALSAFDTSLIDPKVERSPVHLAVDDVPLAVGLAAALDAAGVSYVVWGSDTEELRVVAFVQGGAAPSAAAVASAQAPPTFTPGQPYVLPNGMALPPGIAPDDPDLAMIGGPGVPSEGGPEYDPDLTEALSVEPPHDVEKKP